jgi:rRNA maturation protein Nop10
VCTGNALTLSATPTGAYQYNWSGPNGFHSTVANPVIQPASALNDGAYVLQVSSTGCGTVTRTYNAVVNSVPVLLLGSNSPVCQGNVVYLSVNGVSGSTYHWQGPNGFNSLSQNPAISNSQSIHSGVYTLTVTSPACGVITNTTVVTVGSSLIGINVLSNQPICVGGDLQLTATHRAGFTYSWTGPNGFTSNLQQPVRLAVDVSGQGGYSVQFTSPGCGSVVRSVSIRVNDSTAVAATSNAPVCVNSVIYFSATAPAGSNYTWAGPSAFGSNAQSPARIRAQVLHSGEYTMMANVPGCGAVIRTTPVVVNICREQQTAEMKTDEGTVEGANSDVSVQTEIIEKPMSSDIGSLIAWPNPNTGSDVHLKWEGLSDHDRNITVKVIDATGKVVLLKAVDRGVMMSSAFEQIITFSRPLAKGIYTIETVHNGVFMYVKFIVE